MRPTHHTTHRPSLTGEPLLLHRGVLHRVDSTQVPCGAGAALGACKLPSAHGGTNHPTQGHAHTCAPPRAVRPLPIPTNPEPLEMVSFGQREANPLRSVLGWLVSAAVFCLLALAIVVMGQPQNH